MTYKNRTRNDTFGSYENECVGAMFFLGRASCASFRCHLKRNWDQDRKRWRDFNRARAHVSRVLFCGICAANDCERVSRSEQPLAVPIRSLAIIGIRDAAFAGIGFRLCAGDLAFARAGLRHGGRLRRGGRLRGRRRRRRFVSLPGIQGVATPRTVAASLCQVISGEVVGASSACNPFSQPTAHKCLNGLHCAPTHTHTTVRASGSLLLPC